MAAAFIGATLVPVLRIDAPSTRAAPSRQVRLKRGRDVDMVKLKQLIDRDYLSGHEAQYWSTPGTDTPAVPSGAPPHATEGSE
jgi:hypothetical protein